jgi:NAD(P)-dependent dehydrogenase (short-subunit alcohol dehydrogenase family)
MTESKPLAGKVAIVTGASRGIGRAIARRLAQDGATLVLAARTQATLAAVAGEIAAAGGTALAFPGDLREPSIPAAVIDAALAAHGRIDIVVNNAGAARRGEFLELTDADWTDGFALKFYGAVRISRAAWPHLRQRGGAVLNIVGVGGRTPGADFTIAGSVNGAFLAFTKALAQLGIRNGVQVNAVSPGPVRTDRLRASFSAEVAAHGGDFDKALEDLARRLNIVRIGEPEDIANLVAFVLSPRGRLLQGSLIDIDGGQTKTL